MNASTQATPPSGGKSSLTQTVGKYAALGIGAMILAMVIGQAGYVAVGLGVLAAIGCVALLAKGPVRFRSYGIVGIVFSLMVGYCGQGSARYQAEKQKEAEATAIQAKASAEANKSKATEVLARLSALPPTTPASDVVAACQELERVGGMTAELSGRCGDAAFQQGQNLVSAGKFTEAVRLLEAAAKTSTKKEEATKALASARADGALARAEAALKGSAEKVAAKDEKAALRLAREANQALKDARAAKADEAKLTDMAEKVKAQLWALKAGDEADDLPKKKTWWDNAEFVTIEDGEDCPYDLWALFPTYTPGGDEFERKANAAKRAELVKKLKETTFVLKMDSIPGVKLEDYDFKKKAFPVVVEGIHSCRQLRELPNVSISLNPPSAKPDRTATGEIIMFGWTAQPRTLLLPVPEATAKDWRTAHQGPWDVSAKLTVRTAFQFVRLDTDSRPYVAHNGEKMNIGAGPVLVTNVLGTRIDGPEGTLLDTMKDKPIVEAAK